MISHILPVDPRLQLVVGHPYVASCIGGGALCPQPEQDFWVILGRSRAPEGFLCRQGEALYACGLTKHSEEVTEFALAIGFRRLITHMTLPLVQESSLLAMEYGGRLSPDDRCFPIKIYDCMSADFTSVGFAKLQCQSGALADGEETDRYAVSLSREVRGGFAKVFSAEQDGKAVAGGTLSRLYHGRVVVGGVAVIPRYRGRGLGTAIAAAACRFAIEHGESPILCCNPSLEAFYRNAGFVPAAPLYCYSNVRTD